MKDLWITRIQISGQTIHDLSKKLGDHTPHAQRHLGLNPYNWHRLSWDAFPDRSGESRDFLTRLDDKGDMARLIILSSSAPQPPTWLTERDDWASKPIPAGYFSARSYRFQLRVNPTVKRVVRDASGARRKNGRREAIRDQQGVTDWLIRKGESAGFIPMAESLQIETSISRFQKKDCHGQHASVDITGVLRVTDPALFHQEALTRGIGSAKAFGFGLLCLAPA